MSPVTNASSDIRRFHEADCYLPAVLRRKSNKSYRPAVLRRKRTGWSR